MFPSDHVLRTVYLPSALDDELGQIAFKKRISRALLMSRLITRGMKIAEKQKKQKKK